MIDRFQLYLDILRYNQANTRFFAQKHFAFFRDFIKRIEFYIEDIKDKRILDVGCGKSYWLTLLLHSYSAEVTGIDTEVVDVGMGIRKYAGILLKNGPERALKTFVWDILYGKPYYDELNRLSAVPLTTKGIDLRAMDVRDLSFPDEYFDLVVSYEVFEHIPDVPAALSELRRTMKKGGLTYIYIHLFTSLSGGHSIKWKFPDTNPPDDVPPWDHLRGGRHTQPPSYVNKLRAHQYRAMFEEKFKVLEWIPTEKEGERFLTPEIREELSDYSEGELLTKGIIVIARKD